MLTYNKRIVNGVIVQICTIIRVKNTIRYDWFTATTTYYGEGVRPDELTEITLEEFTDIAAKYNSLCQYFTNEPSFAHSS